MQAIRKTCENCGSVFMTSNADETECLSCKISREMKLPEDTIVNHNVLNIYMAKQWDPNKGVDPIYLKVAEGVALIDRKRGKEQLCTTIRFMGEKDNNKIEKYVSMVLKDAGYREKYDAFVFVKISSHSNFMVFGISLSDRSYNKLSEKDVLFKKNYMISLAVNWYWGDKK